MSRYHDQCLAPSNVSYGTTTSVFHLAMWHAVPRPVQPSNMSYVPLRVYFTWQCAMRYHDQFNLAMCHVVPQPVYFTWQCVMRYHNQCLSPGSVSCGTTTSVFHLEMCYAVPQPMFILNLLEILVMIFCPKVNCLNQYILPSLLLVG